VHATLDVAGAIPFNVSGAADDGAEDVSGLRAVGAFLFLLKIF
jgi:hypothetical protein